MGSKVKSRQTTHKMTPADYLRRHSPIKNGLSNFMSTYITMMLLRFWATTIPQRLFQPRWMQTIEVLPKR